MKTKSIGGLKGMRDIPTIQGLNKQSAPTTRPQAATELARLEHEKVRLERELKMWIGNQKRTESQLQQVEERLAVLQQILDQTADDDQTEPSDRRRPKVRRSPAEEADSGEDKVQEWKEITLEY